jgi:protein transport protein SEC24
MALRPCQGFTTDARVYTMRLLRSMSISTSIAYLYPQIYVLHDLRPEVGVPDAYGHVQLPDMVRASYERLEPNGIYLLGKK